MREISDSCRTGERRELLWINHFAVLPSEGGGTRHYEIARELVKLGWRVTIAASDFHLQSRQYTRRRDHFDRRVLEQTVEGVQFAWLNAAPYSRNNWRRLWNWVSFSRELEQWGRTHPKPDVVIGSSPHLFAAWSGERLARRWVVPFVFEVRDLWPESMLAAGARKGAAYYLLAAIARHLYRRARKILCLARGTATHLAQAGVDRQKLSYVPNGVDTNSFNFIERPTRECFTVVYAGAHGPANGLDTVLEAAELLRHRVDIRFVLVGDGPAKAALAASAESRNLENVELRDPVPKQRIPELLFEADAGLMVLRDSPLFAFGVSPNKLFDYFAAELPVICNVPGEVSELIAAAAAGEQAADGSPQGLADAVVRLADRTIEERRSMGSRARLWVAAEHDRKVLAERLDHALREVLA